MPFTTHFLARYNAARTIYVPIQKRGVQDFAVGADWTPVAGDVKVSKDGGAAANIGTLPTAIVMGNGAIWKFPLTGTELSAAQVVVTVVDAATKAVEDAFFVIETYGNPSASILADFGAADANNLLKVDVEDWKAGVVPAVNVTGTPKVDVVDWLGAAPDALSSGKVAVDVKLWLTVAPAVLNNQLVQGDVERWLNGVIPAVTVTGVPKVDVQDWVGVAVNALVNGRVPVTAGVPKNTALTAFEFLMTDSTNHNPVTGKAVTVTRSIDGGALAGGTLSAVTEISNGIYKVNFGAGDLNGTVVVLRATAAGSDDTFVLILPTA